MRKQLQMYQDFFETNSDAGRSIIQAKLKNIENEDSDQESVADSVIDIDVKIENIKKQSVIDGTYLMPRAFQRKESEEDEEEE